MKFSGRGEGIIVHRYEGTVFKTNAPEGPYNTSVGDPKHSTETFAAATFAYEGNAPFAATALWGQRAQLSAGKMPISILDAVHDPVIVDDQHSTHRGAQFNPQEHGFWRVNGTFLSFKHEGLTGNVTGRHLFYWSLGNVSIETPTRKVSFESKVWDDPEVPGLFRKHNIVWFVLEVGTGASSFEVPPSGQGLYSISFGHTLKTVGAGAIALDSANVVNGALPASSRRTGPALWVGGPINLTLEAVEVPRDEALTPGDPLPEASYVVDMSGDPTAYSIGGGPSVSLISMSSAGVTGASAIGLVALLLTWKFFSLLYTRIEPAHLSGHPVRKSILERLEQGAALRAPELVALTGHAQWAVRHHLHLLQRTGSVIAVGSAWQKRYKLASAPAIIQDPKNSPVADHVVASLNGHPVRFIDVVRDVQSRTGVSKMGVWKAIQRLEGEGRIQRHRKGRKVWVASPGVAIS